ncbi:MAG: hypothetical protein PHO36_16145 [Parabacteroides sp.]|nr:hypothetical protein [Parabacteroides sp.]
MSRVRISNSTLNAYGTRVLTEGVDIEQYVKNPVLLYMHERGKVVGFMKDIKKEGDDITGEPVFDEVTDESKQYKKQWDKGSLRMVSPNFDIIELSSSPEDVLPGQARMTVSKSKLIEVSIVDIGGNDDNIRLTKDGAQLKLSADGNHDSLPLINNNQIDEEMDFKAIALKLGLPETATETDILNSIGVLLGYKEANATLRQEKETLQLAGITQMVEQAVTDRKITADKKEHFITLGKTAGAESLKLTLDAISPVVKPSDIVAGSQGAPAGSVALQGDWKKLSDVPADKLVLLREGDVERYKTLYKAEYGIECVI